MDKKYLENQVSTLVNLYNSQRYNDVVLKGKILIRKFPNQLIFYNVTALSLSSIGKNDEALGILKIALNLSPNDVHILNNLGLINSNLNKNIESRKYLEKAVSINKNFMDALLNLGNLNLKEGKTEEAMVNLHHALKQSKTSNTDETINMAIGNLNQQLGEFDKALENYNIITKINPLNTNADKSISTIHKYLNKDDPHLVSMKEKLNKIKNGDSLKSLYFALGKAHEDIGDFKGSFNYIKLGNKIVDKQINYSTDDDKSLFSELKRIFKNFKSEKILESEKKIIFIVGMPRSGTTLVEQIISFHKNVYGAGELNYMSECIDELIEHKSKKQNPLWIALKDIEYLKYENLRKMQLNYLKKIKLHNYDEEFITDKAPLNFRWIGFIKTIFPNSKIIHCERNSMDICYSNFKNSFSAGSLGFCYNLQKLGNYFKMYKDLMLFWQKKFEDQIYSVSYEKLINNKELEVKNLLEFCGLEWDENCLDPHKNKKAVATASLAQVRYPIYKSSINKWKNVESELEELKKILK